MGNRLNWGDVQAARAHQGQRVRPPEMAPLQRYRTLAEFQELLPKGNLSLVFAHWLEARGDTLAPPRRAITADAIVPALPHLLILDYLPGEAGGPGDYRVRLAGTALVRLFGRDITGTSVFEILHPDQRHLLFESYEGIRATALPRLSSVVARGAGAVVVHYQRLALPLSDDGHTVNRLLAVVRVLHPAGPSAPATQVLMSDPGKELYGEVLIPE